MLRACLSAVCLSKHTISWNGRLVVDAYVVRQVPCKFGGSWAICEVKAVQIMLRHHFVVSGTQNEIVH